MAARSRTMARSWFRTIRPFPTTAAVLDIMGCRCSSTRALLSRSEEHTSELQSLRHLVCRLLLEKNTPSRWEMSLLHRHRRRGDTPHRAPRDAIHLPELRFFFFFKGQRPPKTPPFPPTPPSTN